MPPTTDKGVSARWRTARVIISLFLPNQSQLSRSSAVTNDVSSAVTQNTQISVQYAKFATVER